MIRCLKCYVLNFGDGATLLFIFGLQALPLSRSSLQGAKGCCLVHMGIWQGYKPRAALTEAKIDVSEGKLTVGDTVDCFVYILLVLNVWKFSYVVISTQV